MLQRIKLKNYCQHKGENEFILNGSTVGIIGKNGSGKSNLARSVSDALTGNCLLYTSPSPRDRQKSRMPSSA